MIVEVALPVPVFKTFDYSIPADMIPVETHTLVGRRVRVPFGPRKPIGFIVGIKEQSSFPNTKSIVDILDKDPLLDEKSMEFGRWLSIRYLCSLGEALFCLIPSDESRVSSDIEGENDFYHSEESNSFHPRALTMTEDQEEAIKILHEAIHGGSEKKFLLAGVAAAGKTEVYCRVIEDSLKQGRSALVLVPEVGLAEQMYELLKERFGSEVLFWHGDKTPKERWDDWIQVQKGKFSIVVGPRSAILAPLKNIGVVIVDEEQDSAFKEDRKPRFHVRDVAEKRAEQNSALLLLGSATPSMETMYKVEEGRFQLIDLRHRAVASSAPHVHVVDMKTEKKFFLSTPLEKALEERLKNHEQTILLLNRRGFFRSLRCEDCGWFSKCSTCGLPLVLHSESKKTAPFSPATKKNKPNFPEGAWRCHMCGQKENPPISCPNCGSKKIKGSGSGTQRAAEEIQKRFPWARVLRWDRDSAAKKGKHFEFFKKFKSEEFDILIGTQLVAHGFNFPSVTLVGVMNSDVGLQIPDFRASEKTFQILTQVAGRSGRDIVSGDVYFQTRHADHYAIQSAVKMDFREFSKLEIPFRQELGYPPFTHIVVVRTTGLKKKDAENMTRLTDWAEQAFPEKIRVLGPLQVQHGIPRGQSKFQCVLKIPNELFALFLEEFYKWLPKNSGSFWLDVDPESLN